MLLAARRESLVATAQWQRDAVAMHWRELETPLRWIERGWQAWSRARRHPWALLAPLAAVAVLRPRWIPRLAAGALALSRVSRWRR